MREIKIGLLGLGFMGRTHWDIYQAMPGAKVVALADVDPAKRSGDISKIVGNIGENGSTRLDLTGVTVYEDGFKMIAEADVDMIDICVPTPYHSDYVLAGFAAGKHVFCEKPICRNLEQLDQIRNAVAKTDKFFNVGMCVRAWPEYQHAKQLVDSGKVGAVKVATFRRYSPTVDGNAWENWFMDGKRSGGALVDLHMHDTDFITYMFGRPKKVSSAGIRGVTSDNGVDHVMTSYIYDDGKLVTAEGGWTAAKNVGFEMSFMLVCEKATIKMDPAGYQITWNDGTIEKPQMAEPEKPTGWHQELYYFVDCVRDGVTPNRYQNPQSIFDAMCVLMSEEQSVDSGCPVEVKYV